MFSIELRGVVDVEHIFVAVGSRRLSNGSVKAKFCYTMEEK
jgi:hypothetical protein